jgi:tRNA uridine 5-carboxymethylaminomethyl modification enzyme
VAARLLKYGWRYGLIPEELYRSCLEKEAQLKRAVGTLREISIAPEQANPILADRGEATLSRPVKLEQLLRRPGISFLDINSMFSNKLSVEPELQSRIEAEVKYQGYIRKEQAQIKKLKRLESQKIPEKFDYSAGRGFSTEAREKLGQIRPRTVGQAMRISGVTPADISILLVHLHRGGGDGGRTGRGGLGTRAGARLS